MISTIAVSRQLTNASSQQRLRSSCLFGQMINSTKYSVTCQRYNKSQIKFPSRLLLGKNSIYNRNWRIQNEASRLSSRSMIFSKLRCFGVGRRHLTSTFGKKKKTTAESSEGVSSSSSTTAASKTKIATSFQRMLNDFLGAKPMPPRWTLAWYKEVTLICTVFAITGSSTMVLVRLRGY